MNAILVRAFGAPGVMALETLPDPSPSPTQVVVRNRAIGVNPVDVYIRAGSYPRKPPLPYIPGNDASGVVEAIGSQVTGLKVGARVYVAGVADGSGTYAECVVCESTQVYPLPERLSFAQGAAISGPFATAYRALFMKGMARAGDTVLVHGASGGVGTAAVQLARFRGLRVIGTAGTDRGLALVAEQGAHLALDHTQADYMQQVMTFTSGRGVDVVIEMLANINLDRDLDVLALRGRVVVVGNRGRIDIDPRKIMGKDGAILGMVMPNTSDHERREIHAAIGAGFDCGALTPVVGLELPLADAARAHAAIMEPGAFGKIVLVP